MNLTLEQLISELESIRSKADLLINELKYKQPTTAGLPPSSNSDYDKVYFIQCLISKEFNIPFEKIIKPGNDRHKEVALARHVAMYLCYIMLKLSLKRVAKFFNDCDHTAVCYAVKKVREKISLDLIFRERIGNLMTICKQP